MGPFITTAHMTPLNPVGDQSTGRYYQCVIIPLSPQSICSCTGASCAALQEDSLRIATELNEEMEATSESAVV